jgi:hypothetical protein
MESIRLQLGRIESRLQNKNSIKDSEFQVFSQWGEDGIIQFAIEKLPMIPKTFVEFGVQDYIESNTRFLMLNNYWDGLIIDGSEENITQIKKSSYFWKTRLNCEAAFITKDNINDIISSKGLKGEIGLLSIDIDGNDYWVWEAINCISPAIVIIEYNSLWGPSYKVSTPYKHDFDRQKAHYSNLYWGASLNALNYLASKKGYRLLTANKGGNNVFFVKDLYASFFAPMTVDDCYKKPFFRQSRDQENRLTYLDIENSLSLLSDLTLTDVEKGENFTIKDLYLSKISL